MQHDWHRRHLANLGDQTLIAVSINEWTRPQEGGVTGPCLDLRAGKSEATVTVDEAKRCSTRGNTAWRC